jgi:uncharacterized protein YecT (DUF1311 family)
MKLLPLMLAAGLLLPISSRGAAQAVDAEKQYSAEYAQCLRSGDAAKGVTVAMAGCVNAEYGKQDARLNAAYAAAMEKRSPQAREALRTEQRAWIKRRDASCEKGLSGGTLDMVERPGCRMAMTATRAVELEQAAKPAIAPGSAGASTSEARVFTHDQGVVDLLVIGPAARTLYDRLPGRGVTNACGATGLHKGDGRMACTKVDAAYSCHVWLNVPRQSLADPEEDDC